MKTLLLAAALILPSLAAVSAAPTLEGAGSALQGLLKQCRSVGRADAAAQPPRARLQLVAHRHCTMEGLCCAMWMAGGSCASAYQCADCMNSGDNTNGYSTTACSPDGQCCAMRSADGRCLAPYACRRCN